MTIIVVDILYEHFLSGNEALRAVGALDNEKDIHRAVVNMDDASQGTQNAILCRKAHKVIPCKFRRFPLAILLQGKRLAVGKHPRLLHRVHTLELHQHHVVRLVAILLDKERDEDAVHGADEARHLCTVEHIVRQL